MAKKDLVPFKKGFDPKRNVTGANKGSKWLTTKLDEALRQKADGQKVPYSDLLIKRVLKSAIIEGDMRAVEHIWDRVEGEAKEGNKDLPPPQTIIVINAPAQVAVKRG